MKKLFSLVALISLFSMTIAGLANAAIANVTATVTVTYASVTLDQTTFSYGTMNAGAASSTVALWSGNGIKATNLGSTSSFDIMSTNTTGSSTGWILAADNTGNNYMHKFCNKSVQDCAVPANYSAMSSSYTILESNVLNAAVVAFQLQLTTPTTPTDVSQQSTSVTVQASAN